MDLSMVVDLFSILAVVSSLIFAGLELRKYRQNRERESALELFNTFHSREFMTGILLIKQLPVNAGMKKIEDLLGDRMAEIYLLLGVLEGMGVLVFKKEIRLSLVEDLLAGIIILVWKKLKQMILEERQMLDRATWAEWVQWLAERIMEREGQKTAVPAYIEHRDWKAG